LYCKQQQLAKLSLTIKYQKKNKGGIEVDCLIDEAPIEEPKFTIVLELDGVEEFFVENRISFHHFRSFKPKEVSTNNKGLRLN
jgi:hypothetical protein